MAPADLLSRRTRSRFEEILSQRTLREISTLFEDEGFIASAGSTAEGLGQRRALVRQFHDAMDFTDRDHCARVLRTYRHIYSATEDNLIIKHEAKTALEEDGIDVSAVRWTLPAPATPSSLRPLNGIATRLDAHALARQIDLLAQSAETDPRLVIGTAKELIETTCRTILGDLGIDAPRSWDLKDLLKATLQHLRLLPDHIPADRTAADAIRTTLRTLTTTVQSLAEIRNAYGSGHGPDGRAQGLQPRHARLATNAAATVATFLFETHADRGGSQA